jgi:hypothetical protein
VEAAPVDTFTIIWLVVFGVVAGSLLLRFVKFGGFKAAMFGAPIRRTTGEASGSSGKLLTTLIRVHVLGGGPDRAVGLELVAKSFASYQMVPVAFSESEARNLIRYLQSAVDAAAVQDSAQPSG